ncbi:MAG: GNAT family N-acetyltransferase [Leptolinea sp.]|nr:GNAT family N-acetyltransferase [Leptolinea sp.]
MPLIAQNIQIRPLSKNDEPFLREMLYHAIFVPEGAQPPPRDVIRNPELSRYVNDWGQPGDDGYVAVIRDKPVGAVWIRLLTGNDKGYGYVDDETPELSIAILPEYRGQGIGNALITYLFTEIYERHPAVCLSVSEENPACRLYRRLGFEEIQNDGTSVKMIRKLI